MNHCQTYHSMFEPCSDDKCNELVQRSIATIICLFITTNLIVAMEIKPNSLVDGMKHLTNLMLNFASWEETCNMTLQRWSHHFEDFGNIWFLIHNMLALMLDLRFKSSWVMENYVKCGNAILIVGYDLKEVVTTLMTILDQLNLFSKLMQCHFTHLMFMLTWRK